MYVVAKNFETWVYVNENDFFPNVLTTCIITIVIIAISQLITSYT